MWSPIVRICAPVVRCHREYLKSNLLQLIVTKLVLGEHVLKRKKTLLLMRLSDLNISFLPMKVTKRGQSIMADNFLSNNCVLSVRISASSNPRGFLFRCLFFPLKNNFAFLFLFFRNVLQHFKAVLAVHFLLVDLFGLFISVYHQEAVLLGGTDLRAAAWGS